MSSKIDLLSKSELEYELRLRGTDPDSKTTVTILRKQLRQLLKGQAEPNVKNLVSKLVSKDELEYIEVSLKVLGGKLEDIDDNSRPIDILRYEAKSEHLKMRIKNLNQFRLEEDLKVSLKQYYDEFKILEDKFNEVNKKVDVAAKEGVLRRLSESNIEEENLDDVFDTLTIEENTKDPSNGLQNVEQSNIETNLQTGTKLQIVQDGDSKLALLPMDNNQAWNSMFSKLPNPVMKYFENLPTCDGLKIEALLRFLNVMLKLKSETSLSQIQILGMLQQYSTGPLLSKVLEYKTTNGSLDTFHQDILYCFVPIGLRESLKRDLVTKPQSPFEPLHSYICKVKENCKLLRCNYTEGELVELICMNMSQEDRARLVFKTQPRTFADLNEFCIQSQNIKYVNWERNQIFGRPRPPNNPNRQFVQHPKIREINQVETRDKPKCFNCNKIGHLARNCWYNQKRDQNVSNGKNPKYQGNAKGEELGAGITPRESFKK